MPPDGPTPASAELAWRYADALATGDEAELRRLLAPDAVIWHNVDRTEHSLEDTIAAARELRARAAQVSVTVRRVASLPDGALVLADVEVGVKAGGRSSFPVALVLQIDGDQIVRTEEYLDSRQVGAAFRLSA